MIMATDKRKGTVLVIVIGILAILTLLAATLAVISRVELRASRYERDDPDQLVEAIKLYLTEELQRDKYGMNEVPYDYERLASVHGSPTSSIYPNRYMGDQLKGDDEGFDSFQEEWTLTNPRATASQDWKWFTDVRTTNIRDTRNNVKLVDTTGDGVIDGNDAFTAIRNDASLLPTWTGSGEYSLIVYDLNARASINDHGNLMDRSDPADPVFASTSGLYREEVNLPAIIRYLNGDDPTAATNANGGLVAQRYGSDGRPGDANVDESNLRGTGDLDYNLDAMIGTGDDNVVDDPAEFLVENSQGDDTPFGKEEMDDFLVVLSGRMDSVGADVLMTTGGVGLDAIGRFTPWSADNILAARSIRSGGPVFDSTIPTPGKLGNYGFMRYKDGPIHSVWLERTVGSGKELMLRRHVEKGLNTAAATGLRDFLKELGAVAAGDGIDTSTQDRILMQVAVNLVDMIDTTNGVMEVTDAVTGETYYGVEKTPYIAEVEAAINTGVAGFVPRADGSLPDPSSSDIQKCRPRNSAKDYYFYDNNMDGNVDGTDNNGVRDPGEPVWLRLLGPKQFRPDKHVLVYPDTDTPPSDLTNETGSELYSAQDTPPTGWGKYIKLVNPWNERIDNLGDYRLHFPENGTGWKFEDSTGQWQPYAVSIPDITLAGLTDDAGNPIDHIPARGHCVIVDAAKTYDNTGLTTVHTDVPLYKVVPEIAFLPPSAAIELQYNDGGTWRPVMSTRYPQVSIGGTPAEVTDGLLTEGSAQISDPRPCWLRPDRDGPDATVMAAQNAPWGPDAWFHNDDVRSIGKTCPKTGPTFKWPSTSTALGMFNDAWKDSAGGQTGTGDNPYFLAGTAPGTPPSPADDLLRTFAPVAPETDPDQSELYTGAPGHQLKVMNVGKFGSPADIGFAHAGVEWGTLSLQNPSSPTAIGASHIVYMKNFTDYLEAPTSPYENGQDDDGDTTNDDSGTGAPDDTTGPEIRLRGTVNVNTAPEEVLRGLFKEAWLEHCWINEDADVRADLITAVIVDERTPYSIDGSQAHGNADGPFSSREDFFERMPELFQVDLDTTIGADGGPNSFRREALARFMYNLVTVRSDAFGVYGHCMVGGQERYFWFVLDRSADRSDGIGALEAVIIPSTMEESW
jgi:hypothetical protein